MSKYRLTKVYRNVKPKIFLNLDKGGAIAKVFSAVHNLLTEKEKDLASISVEIEDV